MKNIEIPFFVILFLLTAVCKSSERGGVRVDFDDPIFSKLDEEGKDIIREYAKAYTSIRDFYRNIRMDVTERITNHTAAKEPMTYVPLDAPPILHQEKLFEIRYNTRDGGFSRVDSQLKFDSSDASLFQGKNTHIYYPGTVSLFTPDRGYSLSRNNPDSRFYSVTATRKREEFESTIGFAVLGFDTAPFSVGPILMEDLFFRKTPYTGITYFILSARYEEDYKEGQMVELVSSASDPKTPSRLYTWTVRLSRSTWVIKSVFEQGWTVAGTKFWHRYQCVYDGEFEGMPLLSSYQTDLGIYDTDEARTERLIQQVRWEVTNLVPGPPDISEFDVAQFLPPGVKIGEITTASFTPARIAAIVIGIILVIFGLYLRLRRVNKS